MYENRSDYPSKKSMMAQQVEKLAAEYDTVALIRMEKVRSSQLLPLRKKLLSEVQMLSIKVRIAKIALKKSGITNVEKMLDTLKGQCLLMFTNMSPFKLNVLLGKNKVMLFAREGDVSSIDVKVPAKNTGIAPGPMLTEFKEAKIPTKIDQGTIWITKDTVPAKKGDIINAKLAPLLSKLDIKTVEAGILLNAALERGLQYTQDDLFVDIDKFREHFTLFHQEAVSLSIKAGYITDDNIHFILSEAAQSSMSLALESGYITAETIKHLLQKSHGSALGVSLKTLDYTAN